MNSNLNFLTASVTDPILYEYDLKKLTFKPNFTKVTAQKVAGNMYVSFPSTSLVDLVNTLAYQMYLSDSQIKIIPERECFTVMMSPKMWDRVRTVTNTKFIILRLNQRFRQASEIPWIIKCLPYDHKKEWTDFVVASAGIDFLNYYYRGGKGATLLEEKRPVCVYRLKLVQLAFLILSETVEHWEETTKDWAKDGDELLPIIKPFVTAISIQFYKPNALMQESKKKTVRVLLSDEEIESTPLINFEIDDNSMHPKYEYLFQFWTYLLTLKDTAKMYRYFISVYVDKMRIRPVIVRKDVYHNRTMDERETKNKRRRVDYHIDYERVLHNPVERARRDNFYNFNKAVVYMVSIAVSRFRGYNYESPVEHLVSRQLLKIKHPFRDLETLMYVDGKITNNENMYPIIEMTANGQLRSVDVTKNIFM